MTFISFEGSLREEYALPEKKFNIFDHRLVPEHILLSEGEVKNLLNKYRIKPYQLPKIKSSDPVVRTIKAKPGDVIKIIRESPTAGEAVAYRYVIEG